MDEREVTSLEGNKELETPSAENVTKKAKKRRHFFGKRKDGRRVYGIHSMRFLVPFFAKKRCDAQNHFEDELDITNIEKYVSEKRAEGYTDFSFLHVFLAAYVRAVSQRPAINRFLSGQHIYARPDVLAAVVVKKEMAIHSPDTIIKIHFNQTDTALTVYDKFEQVYAEALKGDTKFDKLTAKLQKMPRFLLRATVSFLRFLDYYGLMPKWLLDISPFHGSVIITSMGSLGINAIFHHLYDFGNLPVFLSYGKKYTKVLFDDNGLPEKHRFITFRAVLDERICDGYYYASGFKIMKRYLLHPELLDTEMTEYVEDID